MKKNDLRVGMKVLLRNREVCHVASTISTTFLLTEFRNIKYDLNLYPKNLKHINPNYDIIKVFIPDSNIGEEPPKDKWICIWERKEKHEKKRFETRN